MNGIGAFLTRPGEGLFGFTYRLGGTADAPQVVIQALAAVASIVFPIILFVMIVMLFKEVRRISEAVGADEGGYYYEDEYEEYEEEYEDEDEEAAGEELPEDDTDQAPETSTGKQSTKKSAEETTPRSHVEDGVMDLERD